MHKKTMLFLCQSTDDSSFLPPVTSRDQLHPGSENVIQGFIEWKFSYEKERQQEGSIHKQN